MAGWDDWAAKMRRLTAATIITAASFGLAGLGVASLAEAAPLAPIPNYHWCPGQWIDPAWGHNWDMGRCHDDFYFDGEPRDAAHWHGPGPWHP